MAVWAVARGEVERELRRKEGVRAIQSPSNFLEIKDRCSSAQVFLLEDPAGWRCVNVLTAISLEEPGGDFTMDWPNFRCGD